MKEMTATRFFFLFVALGFSFLSFGQQVDQQNPGQITKALNTRFDEQNIVLGSDGMTIYFTRSNDSSNVGGPRDKGDIWFSSLGEDGHWQRPKNLGRPVNNELRNAIIGFSPDGKIMFLNNEKGNQGGIITNDGIAISLKQGDGWSEPKKIDVDYFLNKSKHQSGSISVDGNILLLSMQSFGSRGEEDIYVCFYENGKWSQPKNLGSGINTPQQEMTPFLARDNKTLYFSSNGYGGKGGRDIFVAKRLDDTWRSWSKPRNLGPEVNSQGVELGYMIDYRNEIAYFSTTQDSDGYGDIRAVKAEPDMPDDTLKEASYEDMTAKITEEPVIEVVEEAVIEEPKAEPQIVFSGKVLNEKNGRPVTAAIKILDAEKEIMTNTDKDSGAFEATFAKGTEGVLVNIKAPGFMGIREEVEFGDQDNVVKDFNLIPLEVGATIRLNKVYFERGTSKLIESSYTELDRVVEMLTENPEIQIELAGHTDNQGDARLNIKLSQERVDVVQEYLLNRGIDKKRVKGKGYGGSKPVASNASEETRRLNRRVEIMIVKN